MRVTSPVHKENERQRPGTIRRRVAIAGTLVVVVASLVSVLLWGRSRPSGAASWTSQRTVRLEREFFGDVGEWGQLHYTRMAIEPPQSFLNAEKDWGKPEWFFPGFEPDAVVKALIASGIDHRDVDQLLKKTLFQTTPEGTWMKPSPELVLDLDDDIRSKIYALLAQHPINRQNLPIPMLPEFLDERMSSSELSKETLKLFKRLLYRRSSFLFFADEPVMLMRMPDLTQRQHFLGMISRTITYLVALKVDQETDPEPLVEYWRGRSRSKDLQPLIESLKRLPKGYQIDLSHLLTPFARRRIYTYPNPQDPDLAKKNCYWSAFNFFNETPADKYSEWRQVSDVLREEYEPVAAPAFGDVVIYFDSKKTPVHAAVYLADRLLFTKNGPTVFHPWTYMMASTLYDLYSAFLPKEELTVGHYRRKH